MMIPTQQVIDRSIEIIDEEIEKGTLKDRGSTISFAIGYLSLYQVVPISVLNHINEMYYTGKIDA